MDTQYRPTGRLFAPDDRDARHPARAALPPEPVVRKTTNWPWFNKPLNQGQTGTCVGHGGKAWMLIAPIIQTRVNQEPTAFTLYREACHLDEFPDNDNEDLQYGTSVRGLFKAFKARGLVGEYVWADNAETVVDWLCTHGPVVIGVNWYRSMFDTDDAGFLHVPPNDRLGGGHCVALKYYNEKGGYVRGPNSWGDTFGALNKKTGKRDGYFNMPVELLDRLIKEDGEACTALEWRP